MPPLALHVYIPLLPRNEFSTLAAARVVDHVERPLQIRAAILAFTTR